MEVPPTAFPVGTDIRDIAKAHVLASTLEAAKHQRYLTVAYHYSNDEIVAILRKAFPEHISRIPETDSKPMVEHYNTDSSKAGKDLGIIWIGIEQSITDTAARLWEIEASLKSAKAV